MFLSFSSQGFVGIPTYGIVAAQDFQEDTLDSFEAYLEDCSSEMEEARTTFTFHRWMGYGIILGSLFEIGTGLYALNLYEENRTPPDYIRVSHRAVGYTIFTLSTIQTTLGTYNTIKLWGQEGHTRRLIHGTLAYAATGSYLYAGYLAYKGYYDKHRTWMLIASGLSALTGLWIIF
ncbi:MAG: hypothetical protein GXO39_03500 [Thermotogae bacterium]|nr:hypothetical protein [Thermotogota bacterium]